ncbi:MAG TPA: outer membrane lipoprotein-sorting protein [Candidatus Eisenbacteria bacterium]|nr:outer membrane lipoprotein-sorting protein [Candidatus Eisenbacteria bacterium]
MHATRIALALLLLAFRAPLPAAADDGAAVIKQMQAALEPERSTLRSMTLSVTGTDGSSTPITLGEARGVVAGTPRILAVVLAPPSLRGTAYLIQHGGPGTQDVQWVWLPAIGRVRKIVSPEAFTAFLNSDFNYADLGFVSIGSQFSSLGDAEHDGVKCQQVQAVPKETWAYARTVTCVAKDSHLPVDRQIYDPANGLWKVQKWSRPETIDGVPSIRKVSMEDVQMKSRTDIVVGAVRYGLPIPESLFDPAGLGKVADASIWGTLSVAAPPN